MHVRTPAHTLALAQKQAKEDKANQLDAVVAETPITGVEDDMLFVVDKVRTPVALGRGRPLGAVSTPTVTPLGLSADEFPITSAAKASPVIAPAPLASPAPLSAPSPATPASAVPGEMLDYISFGAPEPPSSRTPRPNGLAAVAAMPSLMPHEDRMPPPWLRESATYSDVLTERYALNFCLTPAANPPLVCTRRSLIT